MKIGETSENETLISVKTKPMLLLMMMMAIVKFDKRCKSSYRHVLVMLCDNLSLMVTVTVAELRKYAPSEFSVDLVALCHNM